jgi:hypothetical protein
VYSWERGHIHLGCRNSQYSETKIAEIPKEDNAIASETDSQTEEEYGMPGMLAWTKDSLHLLPHPYPNIEASCFYLKVKFPPDYPFEFKVFNFDPGTMVQVQY